MFSVIPVTHSTSDTKHPLLLLQSEHGDKYFFGKIPEGAQRAVTEKKIKLSKLSNLFLTGKIDWSSIGGLPGMILTLADQGRDSMKLFYGNSIINYIVSTWRYFVFRFGLNLSTSILTNNKIYSDKLLDVTSIVIGEDAEHDEVIEKPIFEKSASTAMDSIVRNMFPKHAPTKIYDPSNDSCLNVKLPKKFQTPSSTTSYEIKFQNIRGRFRLENAVKLGVPRGPAYAALAKGENVTLEDGTIVTPDQVLEKERTFPKILVLDIPDDSYMPKFIERFENYDKSNLGVIYYFLDDSVTFDQKFVEFMELFPENVEHFVSHSEISHNDIVFSGAAYTTMKLKLIQKENYNLPRTERLYSQEFYDLFKKRLPNGATTVQKQQLKLQTRIDPSRVHALHQRHEIKLKSFTKNEEAMNIELIGNEKIKKFSWKAAYNGSKNTLGFMPPSYEDAIDSQLLVNNYSSTEEKSKHFEIVTLGTGSALPSKYRNVLSTLIKVPYEHSNNSIENRCILLDAGENTIGTMKRMFSEEVLKVIMTDLKMIYLSHLHADHHLGIISLLNEWYKYNKDNKQAYIYIVTPWQYNKFVNEWMLLEDPTVLQRIKYISCEHLIEGKFVRKETAQIEIADYNNFNKESSNKKRKLALKDDSSFRDVSTIREMYKDLKIHMFKTCYAKHCHWAYSNAITFYMSSEAKNNLFKVSYSGDTRPNYEHFAEAIGKHSDLLIHEATLDNELIEDAIKKRHSTINEAIKVSNAMNARKLILTHFSQRYPKLPQMGNNIKVEASEYCFAFDGFIVDYEKLGHQQKVFSLLEKAFDAERLEEEETNNSDC